MRIPQNFFNTWRHAIARTVELLDPMWNSFEVRVLRDNQGGYFASDLAFILCHYYLINYQVMLLFRLLRPDFIEMRIEIAPGAELDYPILTTGYPLLLHDNDSDAWDEDNVNGVVVDA